ncbi:hypothetical protein ETAA8_67320 [Anatilimnocola aggregata]|uniref:Class I SAM-dependent methyltransferase n=1 Tax=Anatilimnocola aggregata TaxID=2528021 RepID=A0A517YMX6_9BACT|nr:class I SAM-dependent methyltransferase [Anatilimnocola aggregata]QDU31573.1 hypothetical protein ETAA8_67320 [Anatilimnocola aggregata]
MSSSQNLPLVEPAEYAERVLAASELPDVAREASSLLQECRARSLISDWEGCPKVDDFARLIVATSRVLPAGGSIETGVYQGGTAGPLLCVAAAESFHVSIDPYGLPSQSYVVQDYGNWPVVRHTLTKLTQLAEERQINFCHYLMDSATFVRADLLTHPGRFRIVHLDGDHSQEAVEMELRYFRRRLTGPALFIMDDHDEHFPGVEAALQTTGQGMVRVLHRRYDFPNYGIAGFSAWIHPGISKS